MNEYKNTDELTDEEADYVFADLSGSTADENGIVHYYDEDGIEADTFTPGWGC